MHLTGWFSFFLEKEALVMTAIMKGIMEVA